MGAQRDGSAVKGVLSQAWPLESESQDTGWEERTPTSYPDLHVHPVAYEHPLPRHVYTTNKQTHKCNEQ